MKLVRPISLLALALAGAAPAAAQVQTGEIFGKVIDPSGAPVPGVTVTAESPSLIVVMYRSVRSCGPRARWRPRRDTWRTRSPARVYPPAASRSPRTERRCAT